MIHTNGINRSLLAEGNYFRVEDIISLAHASKKGLPANVDIEKKLKNYVLLLRTIRKIKLIKPNKNSSTSC